MGSRSPQRYSQSVSQPLQRSATHSPPHPSPHPFGWGALGHTTPHSTMKLRPIRALFLGPPGAGKGTITGRLVNDISDIVTISSGDVLRDQISKKTEIGTEAEHYIKRGKLLPDVTMVGVIHNVLEDRNLLNQSSSWILDGFPRNGTQAPALDEMLDPANAALNLVVRLNVPEDVILDRICNRWIHPASGRVYNLTFSPPKVAGRDDLTGEPLVQRTDDNPDIFKKRLESYVNDTLPLLDYYRSKGILVEFAGSSSNELYPKILSYIKDEFKLQQRHASL